MRHVITVVIDRPIAEVWTFSNDVFNAPRLGGLSLAFRQTSKGPMELGSTFEGRVMILGFETRMTGAITEWDPPHASTATFVARPLRSASIRETLETVDEATRFTRAIEFELRPAFRLLWPLLGRFVVGRMDTSVARMKRMLESGPP